MSNKENVKIISARPGVPSFLKFDLVDVYIVLDI